MAPSRIFAAAAGAALGSSPLPAAAKQALGLCARHLALDRGIARSVIREVRAAGPTPFDAASLLRAVEAAIAEHAPGSYPRLAVELRSLLGLASPAAPREDRREAEPSLEVELSFAAGMVAVAASVSFALQEWGMEKGFHTGGELFFWGGFTGMLDVFTFGMVLYLLQRAAWISIRAFLHRGSGRWGGDPAEAQSFRDAYRKLERQCQATLYGCFQYLFQGMVGMFGLMGACVYMCAESPCWSTFGLILVALYMVHVVLLLPGAIPRLAVSARWARRYHECLDGFLRAWGFWWLRPPAGSSPHKTVKYRLAAVLATAYCMVSNCGIPLVEKIAPDKKVYQAGTDTHAVIEITHGGLVGAPGKMVELHVTVDGRRRYPLQQVARNHYVAAIPLVGLGPGRHDVTTHPILHAVSLGDLGDSYVIQYEEEIRTAFVIAGASKTELAAD